MNEHILNVNETVSVELTEYGKQIIREYRQEINGLWHVPGRRPMYRNVEPWDENGVYTAQFHIILSETRKAEFTIGSIPPFTNITFKEPEQ